MTPGGGATLWIVGMMGVGKSAVAQELATRLGRPAIDTDREVEREAGRAISEIFATEGEAAFRRHERAAIEAIAGRPAVVALGGGAIAQPGVSERLNETGTVVCLTARAETLLERIGSGRERPLLAGLDDGARLDRIRALLAERAPHYALAAISVETDDLEPRAVADRVLERLGAAM